MVPCSQERGTPRYVLQGPLRTNPLSATPPWWAPTCSYAVVPDTKMRSLKVLHCFLSPWWCVFLAWNALHSQLPSKLTHFVDSPLASVLVMNIPCFYYSTEPKGPLIPPPPPRWSPSLSPVLPLWVHLQQNLFPPKILKGIQPPCSSRGLSSLLTAPGSSWSHLSQHSLRNVTLYF